MSETQTQTISRLEEITATLRDEILRGQYRPGERLPSERDLAARFDVNRGAIRESLKKLEQIGIASINPGGVRVVPVEEASLSVLRPLIEVQETPDPILIGHLLEVWGTIMSMTAKNAVACATEDQISQMLSLVSGMTNNSFADEEYHERWRQLGTLFTEINNNLVLRLIINGLMTQFLDKPSKQDKINILVDPEHRINLLKHLEKSIAKRDADGTATIISNYFKLIQTSVKTSHSHTDNSQQTQTQEHTGLATYE